MNEQQGQSPVAPLPEEKKSAKEISEKFLLGDLEKMLVNEIKLLSLPWKTLPEKEQQRIIDRIHDRTQAAVRQAVQIIAAHSRPSVVAEIESVTFKDGVKVSLTMSKHQADRHAIADAQGGGVLLVLPRFDKILVGDTPKADKDQPELPGTPPAPPKQPNGNSKPPEAQPPASPQ